MIEFKLKANLFRVGSRQQGVAAKSKGTGWLIDRLLDSQGNDLRWNSDLNVCECPMPFACDIVIKVELVNMTHVDQFIFFQFTFTLPNLKFTIIIHLSLLMMTPLLHDPNSEQ